MTREEVEEVRKEFDEKYKNQCWFGYTEVYWNYLLQQYVIRLNTRKWSEKLQEYFNSNLFKSVTVRIRSEL